MLLFFIIYYLFPKQKRVGETPTLGVAAFTFYNLVTLPDYVALIYASMMDKTGHNGGHNFFMAFLRAYFEFELS